MEFIHQPYQNIHVTKNNQNNNNNMIYANSHVILSMAAYEVTIWIDNVLYKMNRSLRRTGIKENNHEHWDK